MSTALVVADKAHAELGASVAGRWMNCPGSIQLARQFPTPASSAAADEGTAAHALAELALRRGVPCSTYVDAQIEGQEVLEDMAINTQVYVDYCAALQKRATKFWIEHQFSLAALNPPGPMYGTSDHVAYVAEEKTLYVTDLKFGRGVVVEVKGNPQLRYYGLGVLLTDEVKGLDIDQIVITIVQPRALHPDGVVRSETIAKHELIEFAAELLEKARETTKPDAPLKAGRWCRFCPASGACPEQKRQAEEIALVEFDVMPLDVPPAPESLTPAMISEFLPKLHILEDWITAVRAHAKRKLERGEEVPGYKLVEGKSNRKWAEPEKVAMVLTSTLPVDEDELYERKLKSPAQVEKIIGKKNLPSDLTVKPKGGLNMVPAHDSRPAVIVTAGDEFAALSSGE